MRDKDTTNMTTNTNTNTYGIQHYGEERGREAEGLLTGWYRADFDNTCLASDEKGLLCSLPKGHGDLVMSGSTFHRSVDQNGIIQDCWTGQMPPVQVQVADTPMPSTFPANPAFPLNWSHATLSSMDGLGREVLMEAIRYRDDIIVAGVEVMGEKDRVVRDLAQKVTDLTTINGNQATNIAGYQEEIRGRAQVHQDQEVRISDLQAQVDDQQRAMAEVSDHNGDLATFVARIQELEARNRQLSEQMNRMSMDWDNDMELISDRLIQESERRSWCSEYDSVVDDLNSELKRPLRDRTKDYTVTRTYTVTVSTTITARNEDDAADMVDEPDLSVDSGWNLNECDLRGSSIDVY
jgi:hypothetical protein